MPAIKFTSRKKVSAQEEDLTTTAPQEKQGGITEETLADAIEKEKDAKEEKVTEEPAELEAPEEPKEIEAKEEDGATDFKVNNARQNQESEEVKMAEFEIKVFNKWGTDSIKVVDPGLQAYITIKPRKIGRAHV